MHRFNRFGPAALALAAALSTCPGGADAAMPSGQTVNGIRCDPAEQVAFHIHQHLAIWNRGKPVTVPPDVGRPLLANCFYWLHTHTPDGIIHVESPTFRSYTLGDFFSVWGQPLSRKEVASAKVTPGSAMRVWVNGRPYSGNPSAIELAQHTDITIEVGPPWKPVTRFTDWQGN
ncbi:MAG TPA: hypothetical protein VN905_01565 [Candidatus Binatia bacterium]|nr:hypothetical protein [Candidatus Binatia bacterium]